MYSQVILVSLLAAVAQARFGQEQVPIPAIAAVNGGSPGEAPTIAGAAVSDLLAAANPCVKLKRGDQILAELGTGADSIAAAKGIVAAEQNFNPFTFSNPAICTDPSLPANPILRGIIPLIDPDVDGSAAVNALSKKTLTTPLNADGKSIADLLKENGFTDFRGIANDGSGPVVSGDPVDASSTTEAAAPPAAVSTTVQNVAKPSATDSGAVDYGLCNPNMDFVAGRPGRKPDESTFLPIDPLTKQGQQDALNPNIITNRICDQLTNVCQSNQAAKDRCRSCQAQIQALGTKDASTAVAWNDCVDNGVQIVNVAVTDTPASSAAPPAVSSVVNNVVAASSEAGCTITQVISTVTVTVNGGATNVAVATPAAVSNSNSNTNSGSNVQTFTGDLGASPVPVQNVGGGRPFVVKGDSFVNFSAACQRSCAVQNNACSDAANSGGNKSFSVGDCNAQEDECNQGCSNSAAARREKRFIRVYRKRA
ncbi:hypothetical protein AA313_de0200098 [Arthrobotrys entomopaga]|nr:hypothetical protein AA313_de0200098 [Arthrobotrys entomopaga]